jgi:hypothetical protein
MIMYYFSSFYNLRLFHKLVVIPIFALGYFCFAQSTNAVDRKAHLLELSQRPEFSSFPRQLFSDGGETLDFICRPSYLDGIDYSYSLDTVYQTPQGVSLQLPTDEAAGDEIIFDEFSIEFDSVPADKLTQFKTFLESYVSLMSQDFNALALSSFLDDALLGNLNTNGDTKPNEEIISMIQGFALYLFVDFNDSDYGTYPTGEVGNVVYLDAFGPDNAAVMVTEKQPLHFRYSTVQTEATGTHPLYGFRQYGFEEGASSGSFKFYIRGVFGKDWYAKFFEMFATTINGIVAVDTLGVAHASAYLLNELYEQKYGLPSTLSALMPLGVINLEEVIWLTVVDLVAFRMNEECSKQLGVSCGIKVKPNSHFSMSRTITGFTSLTLPKLPDLCEAWSNSVVTSSVPGPILVGGNAAPINITKTDICVESGDVVVVQARGEINLPIDGTEHTIKIDPSGYWFVAGIYTDKDKVLVDAWEGTLLCRISTGPWRSCGKGYSGVSQSSGCLEFTVNDKHQEDNSGFFEVTVAVNYKVIAGFTEGMPWDNMSDEEWYAQFAGLPDCLCTLEGFDTESSAPVKANNPDGWWYLYKNDIYNDSDDQYSEEIPDSEWYASLIWFDPSFPGAVYFIDWSSKKSDFYAGQRCAYDKDKKLITKGFSAGTSQRFMKTYVDEDTFESFDQITELEEFSNVFPFVYERWPVNTGKDTTTGETCSENHVPPPNELPEFGEEVENFE